MRLRPRHLACLILLLSSLSAEASVSRPSDYTLGGHYISVLLAQDHAAICTEAALDRRSRNASELIPPPTALARQRVAWTMRPPSAHALALQAATAFAI